MGELLERMAAPANLRAAFHKVKANRGAAGVDRVSVERFERHLDTELASLRRKLLSKERYQPPPVRRVEIAKPDGSTRPLGIPTVADRVVQQATRQVVERLFEPLFCDCSFGFRPGRGAREAVARVRHFIAQGDRWCAEFDIEGFFDTLSHPRLLREFGKVVSDPEVVGLVRRWLKAGVVGQDGIRRLVSTGTPQGGVISPLLANVYLHRLDREATEQGFRFVRYADDFVVLANRRWKVRHAEQVIRKLLADIGLQVNETKSGVRHLNREQVEFMGFSFHHGRFLRPRDRAVTSFKDQIRYLTRRKRGLSLKAVIEDVTPVVRGWGNYFVQGHVAELFETLDEWVRMRLRSYVTKRRAKSPAINARYPTALLMKMGLVSLVALRKSHLSPAMGEGRG